MKFSILALGAAVASISCASQCVAQLQIDSSTPARTADARLVSQNQDFFGDIVTTKSSADSDYFADEPSKAESRDPASLPTEKGPFDQAAGGQASATSSATRSVAATPAPLGVLAYTPDSSMLPNCWPQGIGCPTPNPVANYLMRSWCTEGLWDTYPQQNALQCQRIQSHIHGYNRYTGAVACTAPGCSAPAAPIAPSAPACNCAQVAVKPTTQLVTDSRKQAPAQLPAAKLPTVQSPAVQSRTVQTPAGQPKTVQSPSVQLPSVQSPSVPPTTAPSSTAKLPPAQGPAAKLPSVQLPPTQLPGVQLPGVQLPGAPSNLQLPRSAADPMAAIALPSRPLQYVQQSAPQPMLELPADVPTVPVGTRPLPNVSRALPALPLPTTVPVIAGRPSAPLR